MEGKDADVALRAANVSVTDTNAAANSSAIAATAAICEVSKRAQYANGAIFAAWSIAGEPVMAPFYSDTNLLDEGFSTRELFAKPIWQALDIPQEILGLETQLFQYWDDRPKTWSFWKRWYQGFLVGQPIDWELQNKIASIASEEWAKGPARIAELIAEIEAQFSRKPLDKQQLKTQALRLIAQPETSSFVATTAADQIDIAISTYLRDEAANCLPEAFEPLYALPPLLRSIGETSQNADRIAELEAQIEQLVGQVQTLTTALEAAAKGKNGKIVTETFLKTTTQMATVGFWGVVVGGISHITGVVDVGTLLERLSQAGAAMPTAEPLPMPIPNAPIDV